MTEIRRARKEDIDDILKLLVQVDMVHHNIRPDLFKGPATKYTAEELEKIIEDDKKPIFVMPGEDGHILGYAFCLVRQHVKHNVLTDIKTLYIDDICIDEKQREKHIGSKIYAYVHDWAKKEGFYNITLNVWEGNDAAKSFYEHMGMKPYVYGMESIL